MGRGEVVVARYKENIVECLDFLTATFPDWSIVVYNKGSDDLLTSLLDIKLARRPKVHALVRNSVHQLLELHNQL